MIRFVYKRTEGVTQLAKYSRVVEPSISANCCSRNITRGQDQTKREEMESSRNPEGVGGGDTADVPLGPWYDQVAQALRTVLFEIPVFKDFAEGRREAAPTAVLATRCEESPSPPRWDLWEVVSAGS